LLFIILVSVYRRDRPPAYWPPGSERLGKYGWQDGIQYMATVQYSTVGTISHSGHVVNFIMLIAVIQ